MNVLVFILILTMSFTLYAKTEGSVKLEGFGDKKLTRKIATTSNDALNLISQLGSVNKPKSQPQVLGGFFGDNGKNSGALTKKRKPAAKSAGKPTR